MRMKTEKEEETEDKLGMRLKIKTVIIYNKLSKAL